MGDDRSLTMAPRDLLAAFAAAPDVTITRLPFGGAVLIDGRTLAVLECPEPEAGLIAALTAPPAGPAGEPAWIDQMGAALRQTAARLVDEGWLVPAANRRR